MGATISNNPIKILGAFVVIIFIVYKAAHYTMPVADKHLGQIEGFDAMGYVYNVPPEWFRKPEYNVKDWLVTTYPDRIQPSCLPYSLENKYNQNMGMMNYWSQAQQFWRF
jgi:hypothetical protein